MKLKLFTIKIIVIIVLAGVEIISQPWGYNFGTGTGTFNTSDTESTSFLPAPQSNGGTARVRVGTEGGGFFLENPGSTLGTDSELRGTAPTSSSINKFSIYGWTGGKDFYVKFDIRLDGASDGLWLFFIGSGPSYSDNNQPSGSHAFTDIYWDFNSSNALVTYVRQDGSWGELNGTGTQMSQGLNYTLEIYGNNTTQTINYVYSGTQSVAANRWDLWINGGLVGDDLQKDGFTDDTNIDAFMFYGVNNAANDAAIYLDNFLYNNLASIPVELTSFAAALVNGQIQLKWQTATEVNNYGFEIQKSLDSRSWTNIAFIPGHGNSNSPKNYEFIDRNSTVSGNYFYRLKQLDDDGKYEYSKIVNISANFLSSSFDLSQNFPNPFNPSTKISFSFAKDSKSTLKAYNALGNEVAVLFNGVAAAGRIYEVDFNGKGLSSGVYYYKLEGPEKTEVRKMLLVK